VDPTSKPLVLPVAGSPGEGPQSEPSPKEIDRNIRLRKAARNNTACAKFRERKAERERLLAQAESRQIGEQATPGEQPSPPPADERTDDELARDIGRFFVVLWPVFRILASALKGVLDPLTEEDKRSLGAAWVPIVRKSTLLLWVTKWLSGPATLVEIFAKRFHRGDLRIVASRSSPGGDGHAGEGAQAPPSDTPPAPVQNFRPVSPSSFLTVRP
jgi:hypothetical protein